MTLCLKSHIFSYFSLKTTKRKIIHKAGKLHFGNVFALIEGIFLKNPTILNQREETIQKNDFYVIQKKDPGFPSGFNENPQDSNWIPKRQVLGSQKYSEKVYGLHSVSTKKVWGIPKRVPTTNGHNYASDTSNT